MNWLKCPRCGNECFKVSQSGSGKCCDCGNQIKIPFSRKQKPDKKPEVGSDQGARDAIPGERFFR